MAVAGAALSRGAGRVSRRLDRLSERRFALLVSVPGLILVALIVLPPTLAVFGMSLFRIELGKDDLVPFIGLRNYLVRLPADKEVLDAIPRTLFFAALSTAITLPLALVTALVLNRGFRGVSIFFMALLLPWAVASIVAGIFWRAIFDTNHGIVNGVLVGLGIFDRAVQLAGKHGPDGRASRWSRSRGGPSRCSRSCCWPPSRPSRRRSTGRPRWTARRPGRASASSRCPAIKNTLIVVGVLQVIIGLQVFDLLYSLTSGGPGRDTYVLIMAIYDITFGQISLGYGAAITVILFLIIVACSFLILIAQGPPAARRSRSWTTRPRMPRPPGRTSLRLDSGSATAIRPSATRRAGGRPAEPDPAAADGRPRSASRSASLALFFFFVAPDRLDDRRQPAADPGPRVAAPRT